MLKFLLSLVVSVGLAVAPILSYGSEFNNIRQATHLVTGEFGTCSGVMVAEGHMLTAAHCDQGILVVGVSPAKVLKKDEDADLLLLKVDMGCPCVEIGEQPYVDDKVETIGFPLYGSIKLQILTEGRVQGILPDRSKFYSMTSPIMFGNSGGGVFKDGKLVGIVSALFGDALGGMFPFVVPHLAVAVRADVIKDFVNAR